MRYTEIVSVPVTQKSKDGRCLLCDEIFGNFRWSSLAQHFLDLHSERGTTRNPATFQRYIQYSTTEVMVRHEMRTVIRYACDCERLRSQCIKCGESFCAECDQPAAGGSCPACTSVLAAAGRFGPIVDEKQTAHIRQVLATCAADHREFVEVRAAHGAEFRCHVCASVHDYESGSWIFSNHGGERACCSERCAIEYAFFRRRREHYSPFFATQAMGALRQADTFEAAIKILDTKEGRLR